MADEIKTENNDALIQEMIAKLPTEQRNYNPVVSTGGKDSPLPMVMTVEDPGLVTLYDTKTGEAVRMLKYMLPHYLKVKYPGGTSRFTAVKPTNVVKRGALKCLLHPDNPNRKHYDELGLPVCKKENLTSPYGVNQHVQKRHPSAWAIVEKERIDKEKEEDRALQRLILMSLAGKKLEAEEPKHAPIVEAVEKVVEVKKTVDKPSNVFLCPTCGADFTNKTVFDKHVKDCK